MTSLAGKVVLVTGGAKGIGQAVCSLFGRQGAKACTRWRACRASCCRDARALAQVVVADVNADAASATAAALAADGVSAFACAGDVGKRADADRMVSAAVQHFGGVDILVANAGIVRATAFLDMTDEVTRPLGGLFPRRYLLTAVCCRTSMRCCAST